MSNPYIEVSPEIIRWVAQAIAIGFGGLVLRYLHQIRNDVRRSIWQNDVMWSVFCIERDIPLSTAKHAGTQKGKEVAIQIITQCKRRRSNGSAAAAGDGGVH